MKNMKNILKTNKLKTLDLSLLDACSWVALIATWFFGTEPSPYMEHVQHGTFAIVAVVGAAVAVTAATAKSVDGAVQANKARKKAEEAEKELEKQKSMFANLDTSNPYLNMENTMEDLTVNTQAAEFQKQQSMQNQANIMQQMRGAAGGSGIAALAQTLASQGSLDAQKASADIAKQEAANQMAQQKEAGSIQQKEREGELMSRQMENDKLQSQMGMTADEIANQRDRQEKAKAQMYEGAQEAGKAATSAYTGGVGGGSIPTGQ